MGRFSKFFFFNNNFMMGQSNWLIAPSLVPLNLGSIPFNYTMKILVLNIFLKLNHINLLSYILKQTWCLSVCLSVLQGRTGRVGAGQGGQTFSVMLRITDFWPQSGFGNFDLLLFILAAVAVRIPNEISP